MKANYWRVRYAVQGICLWLFFGRELLWMAEYLGDGEFARVSMSLPPAYSIRQRRERRRALHQWHRLAQTIREVHSG